MKEKLEERPALAGFAALLHQCLKDGIRPATARGEPWTYAEFSEEVIFHKSGSSSVSMRSVSNWCNGIALPREIDPILRALFGSGDRHAERRDMLRRAFQMARDEKELIKAKRHSDFPGFEWKLGEDKNFVIDIDQDSEKISANIKEMQDNIRLEIIDLTEELVSRSRKLSNSRLWSGLSASAAAFKILIGENYEKFAGNIAKAYTLILRIARYLETDVRVQRDPDQEEGPLDPDVHGALDDFVRVAAPWSRTFPEIAALDDQAGRALVRPELFQPAREFTYVARKKKVISDQAADQIDILSETAHTTDFQGQKAGVLAVGTIRNLIIAEVQAITAALSKSSDVDINDPSSIAYMSLDSLSESKTQLDKILELMPKETQMAVKSIIERAHDKIYDNKYSDGFQEKISIEDLIAQNESLKKAAHLRDTFVHHVAYELRSPLTNIIGFTQLLGDEAVGALNERQREYSDHIMRSSAALLVIINDILDLGSIDAGSMKLQLEETDVQAIIEASVRGIEDRLAESRIRLVLDVPDDIGSFLADGKRVRQILFNLLSNAVGFSDPGQRIEVRARRTGRELTLSVRDYGRGMPPEIADAVFDRFESHTLGTRHRGVGLGLSIVRSFVELHGGRVQLETAPRKGTCVTCIFPLDFD